MALRYGPGTGRAVSLLGTAGGGTVANYICADRSRPVPARVLPAVAVVSRRRAR